MRLNGTGLARISFWLLVAVYTICLPYVILVFRAINRNYSSEIAAQIPLGIILFLAVVYLILGIKNKRTHASIAVMVFSGIIIYIIMMFQPNVNKHIHIPEYVIMCWFLYKALSIDYKGSGIYLLIFLCATVLGVIDELLQGIHPQRFYGWSDMLVNSAASLIGVLALLPLLGLALFNDHPADLPDTVAVNSEEDELVGFALLPKARIDGYCGVIVD